MIKRFIFFLIQIGHHVTDHPGSVRAVVYVTLTAAPAEGVLEAGRDAEGPVAARGLVSGRDPRTQSRGRDGARKATEASSRTQGEGPGSVPATWEGPRSGMFAEAPESTVTCG